MKNILTFLLLLLVVSSVYGQKKFLSLELKGQWQFSIGDDPQWAETTFDDSEWESIYAPSPWEDEGFHGYNGFAWYRKSFTLPADAKGKPVFVELGRIDDVDQVYCNGRLIGATGSFPPEYMTAYDQFRTYKIPSHFLSYNTKNIIAVRVYDSQLSGGFIEGPLRITIQENALVPEFNLEGQWSLIAGDKAAYSEPDYKESGWKQAIVPSNWETQGLKDYDGVAWYRKRFNLPQNLHGKNLVLLLGRIDDIDEAFINGIKIGSTGIFNSNGPTHSSFDQEYLQLRGYYIPAGILKNDTENVIAVRVYDGFQGGGIYDGPIGIITQTKYQQYWKSNKTTKRSFLEWLFD